MIVFYGAIRDGVERFERYFDIVGLDFDLSKLFALWTTDTALAACAVLRAVYSVALRWWA